VKIKTLYTCCEQVGRKEGRTTKQHAVFILPSISTHTGRLNTVASILARLQAKQSGTGIPERTRNSSLSINVQTGSGPNPASYLMGSRDSFPKGKVTGRLPLAYID
jgi:hypothetical protein